MSIEADAGTKDDWGGGGCVWAQGMPIEVDAGPKTTASRARLVYRKITPTARFLSEIDALFLGGFDRALGETKLKRRTLCDTRQWKEKKNECILPAYK